MRFLDLVFLHGTGCPGALDPHSRDSLGSQHHAEKLSQRIALHFRKVQKKINATIDLSMDEIEILVKRFANDPTPISRFLVTMSHGNKNGLMDIDGITYDYNKIILDAFSSKNAPHLINFMKLIIIQACRYFPTFLNPPALYLEID